VLAVVYEAMADAGTRGKSRKVSGPHRVSHAVYPRVHFTFKDVHKLFLFLLGVRPRASLSRRQSHQVHADLAEAGSFADAPSIAGVFVAVRILVAPLGTRLGSNDEGWSLAATAHAVPVTQPDLRM
jgi:hypothetical protein